MIYDKLPGYRWNIIGILGSESKFQILLGQAGAGAGEDGGVRRENRSCEPARKCRTSDPAAPHRYGGGEGPNGRACDASCSCCPPPPLNGPPSLPPSAGSSHHRGTQPQPEHRALDDSDFPRLDSTRLHTFRILRQPEPYGPRPAAAAAGPAESHQPQLGGLLLLRPEGGLHPARGSRPVRQDHPVRQAAAASGGPFGRGSRHALP